MDKVRFLMSDTGAQITEACREALEQKGVDVTVVEKDGNKVLQKKSPGMIGVLIGLLTYAAGPISLKFPPWYLVLIAISILLVLHSKGKKGWKK